MAREKNNVSLHLCSLRKIGPAFRTRQVFKWKAKDQKCLKVWGLKDLPLGYKEDFNRMGKGRDRNLV